jgi:signal peptidase I
MENFTFQFREPRRGDIVIFKNEGIGTLDPGAPGMHYAKRVAGEPRDHVFLSNDVLFINEKLTVISNDFGPADYRMPSVPGEVMLSVLNDVTVPDGSYFLLGDNGTNSYDSRMYGSVPRKNITGRVWICYWPPERMGLVR